MRCLRLVVTVQTEHFFTNDVICLVRQLASNELIQLYHEELNHMKLRKVP